MGLNRFKPRDRTKENVIGMSYGVIVGVFDLFPAAGFEAWVRARGLERGGCLGVSETSLMR